MDHRKSDRRSARRYETLGPMWGTVSLTRELVLRNIGRGGVQIESPCTLPLNSAHTVVLPFLREASPITARVRYAAPENGAARAFRIGLEFVAPPPAVVNEIDALVAAILEGV